MDFMLTPRLEKVKTIREEVKYTDPSVQQYIELRFEQINYNSLDDEGHVVKSFGARLCKEQDYRHPEIYRMNQ